jgi:hypothetical protein
VVDALLNAHLREQHAARNTRVSLSHRHRLSERTAGAAERSLLMKPAKSSPDID